jgi:hypothetical protein
MAHDVVRASGRLSFLEAQMAPDFLQKAYTRIHEGMDAVKVKVLQHEGAIVLGPEQIDYTERREAAKEALKLCDQYPDRLDLNVGGDGLTVVLQGLDEGRV